MIPDTEARESACAADANARVQVAVDGIMSVLYRFIMCDVEGCEVLAFGMYLQIERVVE